MITDRNKKTAQPGVKPPESLPSPQPIASAPPSGLNIKSKFTRKKLLIWGGSALALTLAIILGGWVWYQSQLAPVGTNKNEHIKVTVESGSTPAMIGQLLKDKNVIRNEQAFSIYTRLSGTQNLLQAGTYRLSPGETTPEIVGHLKNGDVDTFEITFYPGSTLAQNRTVLIKAGYTEAEVDGALKSTYDSPLFDGKPDKADLEGYIYGETYRFGSDATVKTILERTFALYADVLEENDLKAQFHSHSLNVFEGITLASIIQREAVGGDEAQIAQVFYKRLAEGMKLGSDVTYQYIADKTGVERDVDLDSPYNTRRYGGLPPGPISAPGKAALLAVGKPAKGDYLYFLSGDDNKTYFARTNAEHEKNIADHCKVKCTIL